MSDTFRLSGANRLDGKSAVDVNAAERALKNFRYVVAAVNDDALKTWAELWDELRDGVTPGGMVLPEMADGFKPSCGWAEFLEKFWLLKHYLDYTHRFCNESPLT